MILNSKITVAFSDTQKKNKLIIAIDRSDDLQVSLLKPVSIKHGLQTADYRLRTGYKIRTRYKTQTGKYGLGIKHGLGIKRRLQAADWV